MTSCAWARANKSALSSTQSRARCNKSTKANIRRMRTRSNSSRTPPVSSTYKASSQNNSPASTPSPNTNRNPARITRRPTWRQIRTSMPQKSSKDRCSVMTHLLMKWCRKKLRMMKSKSRYRIFSWTRLDSRTKTNTISTNSWRISTSARRNPTCKTLWRRKRPRNPPYKTTKTYLYQRN